MLRSRLLIFKAFLEGVPSVFDVLLFVCCVGFASFVCFLDVGVCVCVDWLSGWHVNLHWQYFSHQFPIFVSSQPPVSQSLASDHPPMSLSPLSLASANPTRLSGCQEYGTGSLISRRCKFWSSKGPGFWPK